MTSESREHEPVAAGLIPHLTAIRHATEAQRLLEDGFEPGTVHLLPCWRWERPAPGVLGRKDDSQLHPVAISWEESAVVVVPPGRPHWCTWRARGLGLDLSGTTQLNQAQVADPKKVLHAESAAVDLEPRNRRELEHVALAGRSAIFHALELLKPYVSYQVSKASLSIGRDLSPDGTAGHAADDVQREEVVTSILYGADSSGGRLWRAVQRCAEPQTTRSVDPIRYLSSQIRRDANDGVRAAIGDPRIGPRIRRLARSMEHVPSLGVLIEEYNRRYPSDKLSTSRAINALTAAPSLDADASRWADLAQIGGIDA